MKGTKERSDQGRGTMTPRSVTTHKKLFLSFLIGSSIAVTSWSELYLGFSYDKAGCPCDLALFGNQYLKFWLYPIIVPILFGLFNVLAVYLIQTYKLNQFMTITLVGAILGLTMSILGRFGFGFPRKVFGMASSEEYTVHLWAPLIYGAIFAIVLFPLNKMFILE